MRPGKTYPGLPGGIKPILQTACVLAAFLFFFTSICPAETVSSSDAEKMVTGWLKADNKPLGMTVGQKIRKTDTFTDANGQLLYHVVYLEPDGFVIAAADNLAEPVICFAEKGQYNPSADNPLGALVGRDLPARIAAAKDVQFGVFIQTLDKIIQRSQAGSAAAKWKKLTDSAVQSSGAVVAQSEAGTLELSGVSGVRVAPLVASRWGQANIGGYGNYPACFNYYTPPNSAGDPNNYPCGCVATAMAQLMRYYQYPAAYSWSDMPLVPDLSATVAQRQAIGDLCYDAAQSVGTVFKSTGSTALLSKADEKLRTTFGYSNSIYGNISSAGSALNGMINPNLDAGKPVFLGIHNSSTDGHAVICDGYGYNSSTLYHHLNMGWDGDDDAWYNLPNVDASSYAYSLIDSCIYNIFVSGTGEIISGRVTDMAGNPIPDVNVSANATGTGTYLATTNAEGIYAFANVPSSKTYTVTATKSPYGFAGQSAPVGKSMDNSGTSGNKWAVNFASQSEGPPIAYDQAVAILSGSAQTITLEAADDGRPNPPALINYKITKLPLHGRLTDPAAGRIKNVPYTILNNGNVVSYQSCSYYTGADDFEFAADDSGVSPQGGIGEPATVTIDVNNITYTTFAPMNGTIASWPLKTSYYQARTQVIYLSADIGDAKIITDLALDIYTAPGQVLNNWTIRMKHTTKTAYASGPYFQTTGWTTVYQGSEQPTPIGWRYFHLQTPFEYNGSNNLFIDFSFNNTSGSTNGYCQVSDTGATRVIMSYANGTSDPLNWSDSVDKWDSTAIPNIKLTGVVPASPIAGDFEPDCDVDADDLSALISGWLGENGQSGFDAKYDISNPADDIINFNDLAVLAGNWLEEN
jgi:hypothetical protein